MGVGSGWFGLARTGSIIRGFSRTANRTSIEPTEPVQSVRFQMVWFAVRRSVRGSMDRTVPSLPRQRRDNPRFQFSVVPKVVRCSSCNLASIRHFLNLQVEYDVALSFNEVHTRSRPSLQDDLSSCSWRMLTSFLQLPDAAYTASGDAIRPTKRGSRR